VDVRFSDVAASPAEVGALDALLGPDAGDDAWDRAEGGVHRASAQRHHLLAGLHALNDRVGYISEGGLGELCRRLDVAPSEGFGVASFYAMFSMEPVPARTVHVCTDLACAMRGGDALLASAGAAARGRSDVRVLPSPCLGVCERAPAVLAIESGPELSEAVIAPADGAGVGAVVTGGPAEAPGVPSAREAVPQAGDPSLVLLRRVGVVDPTSLDDYRREGGYEALRRAVSIGPTRVIDEVTTSKLVGRGGAAFPAGRKWAAVAAQPARPHYLVCNADESEPGTFKDRVLLEGDPFAVIEAMTIAGYATGCEHGYVYVRGEYPQVRERLQTAIDAARLRGLLGPDVMGEGFAFDIEIAVSSPQM
jgi:NADH-quinone oxidoreductase subunit F